MSYGRAEKMTAAREASRLVARMMRTLVAMESLVEAIVLDRPRTVGVNPTGLRRQAVHRGLDAAIASVTSLAETLHVESGVESKVHFHYAHDQRKKSKQ